MADTHFTIEGNLTRDPELTHIGTEGTPKVRLGIAVNRRWENSATKKTEERVSFFTVEAWRTLAENTNDSLKKGDRVLCTGTFEQQRWDDEDGNTKSAVVFTALSIAPALRWAVAEPKRNEKVGGNGAPATGEVPPDEEPF